MSIVTARQSGEWLLKPKPILSLARGVTGVRKWTAETQTQSAVLYGLLEKGDLLPDIDVKALLNPLYGLGLGVSSGSRNGDFTSVALDNLTLAEDGAGVKSLSPIQERWPWLKDDTERERGRRSYIQAREILARPGKLLILLEKYSRHISPEHSVDKLRPSHSTTPDLQGIGVRNRRIGTQTEEGHNIISFPIRKAFFTEKTQRVASSSTEPFTALETRAAEKLYRWLQHGTATTDSVLKLIFRRIKRRKAVGESGQTGQRTKASIPSASLTADLSMNLRRFTHTGPSGETDLYQDGNSDANNQKEGPTPEISDREGVRRLFIKAREFITRPGKLQVLLENYSRPVSPEHSVDQERPSRSITPDSQGIGIKTDGIGTQTEERHNIISFPIKKASFTEKSQRAPSSSSEPSIVLKARAAEKLHRLLPYGTVTTDSVLRLFSRKIRRQRAAGESGQTGQKTKASIPSASLMADLSKDLGGFIHTDPSAETDPNHDGNRDASSQREGSNPRISGTKIEDGLKRTVNQRESKGGSGLIPRISMTSIDGEARKGESQRSRMINSLERVMERLTSDKNNLSYVSADADIEIGETHSAGQYQGAVEKGASESPLVVTVQAAIASVRGVERNGEARIERMINSLERVVESLTNIEASLSETRVDQGSEKNEPAVQWLEDEDLAGRLQRILKRQARLKGIELS